MTVHTTTPTEAETAAEHWSLLFGVRRSVRYHVRRERYFDRAHHFGAFVAALSGSATITALLAGHPVLVTVAAAATALCGAGEMVFGLARKARLHSNLAHEFIALEKALIVAGEDLAESRLREFEAVRLDIEAREPPVLRVLDAMCHDELVTALGIESGQRSNLSLVAALLRERRRRRGASAAQAGGRVKTNRRVDGARVRVADAREAARHVPAAIGGAVPGPS